MSGPGAVHAKFVPSPWLIAVLVAGAAFMEVLDSTIANVVLPYIAGSMAVSADEASWVITTYLVSNAVIITATGYLARRFNRKRFFLFSLVLFTMSSLMCGLSDNISEMLIFRVFQGLAGGGMVPLAQSILADSFPPDKRGQGFAVFGIAVVVGPVVGPTLGGWLADNFSWNWCFLINVPVGILMTFAIYTILPEPPCETLAFRKSIKFDAIGFGLVATFLGALELVLDRGLEDDWFSSPFIVGASIVSASAFALMVPWEFKQANPVVEVRLVATRQFGSSLLVMLAIGAIVLATTQFTPQLVQQVYGYTAALAGLLLSPGGLVTMVMMVIVGRLSGKVQPKYMIAVGASICALSMYRMTNTYSDLGFWFFAQSRMLLGVGVPLIFIPITAASYDGVPPSKTDQASALMNVARNTGGSIGIAIVSNILAHREQFHQTRLVEHVVPSGPQYQSTLNQTTSFFLAQGSPLPEAQQQAIAWIGNQVRTQATYLGYVDAFWALTLISLAAVPLALILRKVKLGQGPVAVE